MSADMSSPPRDAVRRRPGLYGSRGRPGPSDAGIRRVAPTFGKASIRPAGSEDHLVESPAERLVSDVLAVDPTVSTFRPQPFKVDLIEGRICRTLEEFHEARAKHKKRVGWKFYTPDFAAKRPSLRNLAIEVKTERHSSDVEYLQKLDRAREILEAHTYQFLQFTAPDDSRHPIRPTMGLLVKAQLRTYLWPDAAEAERVSAACSQAGSKLGDLCRALSVSVNLAPVWLVCGVLRADLTNHPINGDLRVEPAHGDLDHLSLLKAFCK